MSAQYRHREFIRKCKWIPKAAVTGSLQPSPQNTSMGRPRRISRRFFPARYGMDIQSIPLFLWLKIPLLSEKLVERHTGDSFHRLPFVWWLFLLRLEESYQLSVHVTIVHRSRVIYSLQCKTHVVLFPSVPLTVRSESQRAESFTRLVLRSWVPKVRIQHCQYCWRTFPLFIN